MAVRNVIGEADTVVKGSEEDCDWEVVVVGGEVG